MCTTVVPFHHYFKLNFPLLKTIYHIYYALKGNGENLNQELNLITTYFEYKGDTNSKYMNITIIW